MEQRHFRGVSQWPLIVTIVVVGLTSPALAGPIATDSYLIGTGEYTAGTTLKSQLSVAATGFQANSIYNQGSVSSNYYVNAGGLVPSDPANAGQVSYSGYGGDNNVHSIGRLLNPVTAAGTYWFSINVSQDGSSVPVAGTTNGYALAGFGNTVPPLLGTTAGNLQGLFFGFAHEPTDATGNDGDLVIRYRNGADTSADAVLMTNSKANTTYSIIAELNVNVNGGSIDNLTYWVNPTNTSSVAAMDATSLVTNDPTGPLGTYALQASTDFSRITYSAQNWNGDGTSANFGDPTLGLSLSDVVPATVPEPSSVALLATGLLGGLGLAIRRRRSLALS